MADQLFTNNASSLLAASIDDMDTTVQVSAGAGALFPAPAGGQFFYVTLENDLGDIEIVKCTGRTSDVLTVERGADGTTPQAWTLNVTRVELRLVAATFAEVMYIVGNQSVAGVKTFSDAPVLSAGLELGHPTDTTLARIAAGRVSIEGGEVAKINAGYTWTTAQQFPTIELGHASDTTLARKAAGVLTVEGRPAHTSRVITVNAAATMGATHHNAVILHTDSTSRTYTLPSGTGVFEVGDGFQVHTSGTGVTVINGTTNSQTISWFAGDGSAPATGNRTGGRGSVMTVIKTGTSTWSVFGGGIT